MLDEAVHNYRKIDILRVEHILWCSDYHIQRMM